MVCRQYKAGIVTDITLSLLWLHFIMFKLKGTSYLLFDGNMQTFICTTCSTVVSSFTVQPMRLDTDSTIGAPIADGTAGWICWSEPKTCPKCPWNKLGVWLGRDSLRVRVRKEPRLYPGRDTVSVSPRSEPVLSFAGEVDQCRMLLQNSMHIGKVRFWT